MPRYFQLLTDFTFTAEHRPGKLNIPDDTISRRDDLPEMKRDEKEFHSSRSFVDQMTSISQLEALEDIAMEFADLFPALWAPQAHQTNAVWPCSPQDIVTTDIATPNIQQNSICPELHPKLQYLNEIQLKFRGKVGDTDKYLTEMLPPVPPIVASVSSAGAPVCPAVIQAAPAGAPGSSAVLSTAPLARDPPRSTEIHRDPLKSIGPQTPRMGQAPLHPTTTRLSRQQAQAGHRHPGILAPWQPGTLAPGHPRALVAVPAVEPLDPHLGEEDLVLMKHLRKRKMSLLLPAVQRTLTRLPHITLGLPPRREGCLLPPTRMGLWCPRAQVTQVTHLEETVGWVARLVR